FVEIFESLRITPPGGRINYRVSIPAICRLLRELKSPDNSTEHPRCRCRWKRYCTEVYGCTHLWSANGAKYKPGLKAQENYKKTG
ncbi:MAG: hypothetical protein R6V12_11165, partial [Candidatus Hydrogenedentota bacterium]